MADTQEKPWFKRSEGIAAMIAGGLIGLLALSYAAFLRLNYSALYTSLDPVEAAAIVTELELNNVRFKLRNGGSDIFVPAHQADAIRLDIIDSTAPIKKMVGFELFNETEMGLTDFAQKIKYQRALQGELSQTIMLMDGIENARVHIAMPERTLFRSERSAPKAAITIVSDSAMPAVDPRITGIRQLVAASVPDLISSNVVVLDSDGKIISPAEPARIENPEPAGRPESPTAEMAAAAHLPENSIEKIDQDAPGPTPVVAASPIPSAEPPAQTSPPTVSRPDPGAQADIMGLALRCALAALAILFFVLMIRKRLNPVLQPDERDAFVDQLRSALGAEEKRENAHA